ncbi:hypothetical protein CUC08_Gglean013385 [Alternaria sp. MG1]|nr:hypothetical protein CUC08_Gglean013385 [Alternaria sp. MG1]
MSPVEGEHIAKEPADSVIIVGVVTKDSANVTAVGFVLIADRVYEVADSLSSVTTVDLLEGNKDVNSLVIRI